MAELLSRREFWNRIDRGDVRTLVVVVLRSWKAIAEHIGEEAIDIAEKLFLDICRFATRDATAEARLSHMVFAAYWSGPARQQFALEVFQRWFPMQVSSSHYAVPIEATWFALEVTGGETPPEVFERVAAKLDPEALPRGWDGQVG